MVGDEDREYVFVGEEEAVFVILDEVDIVGVTVTVFVKTIVPV